MMKKHWIRAALVALCLCMTVLFGGCAELAEFLPQDLSDTPVGEPEGQLTLEFLYVGQADCTLILLPSGETMLVDGGNDGDGDDIANYLQQKGIARLDYVVGTHPHEDHIGGLDKVIAAVETGTVYLPELPAAGEPDTKNYTDFLAAAKTAEEMEYLSAGERLYEDSGLVIDCLSPDSGEVFSELNNYSIVLKITYGEDEILLMGDAEDTVEEILLADGQDLDVDLLKVGHHGSSTSSSEEFIRAATPEYAIISCGVDNSYGFPHEETLDILSAMGAQIYDMSQVGSVTAISDGDGLEVWEDPTLILDEME